MNGSALTILSAFLLGLLASGHCLVMCGGISGALAMVTGRNARGRPRADLLAAYQAGRIVSYALAGLSLAGVGALLVHYVDQDQVRLALRWVSGLLIIALGVNLLRRGRGMDFALGRALWQRLAPFARHFMPVRNIAQAFAIGSIWGWMPCGLAYSVLFIAWLSVDAWHSALIMLAFGVGTAPAVFASAYGAAAGARLLAHAGLRSAISVALIAFGMLTAGGPWLLAHTGLHALHWLPLDCLRP